MRVVPLSDMHGLYSWLKVPDGDVLAITGDMTNMGTVPDIREFYAWLEKQPHKEIVFIAGNHDWWFQNEGAYVAKEFFGSLPNVVYLEDELYTTHSGHTIYGTPWQPVFCDWAFNVSDAVLEKMYAKIPNDVDILLTHIPPYGILDKPFPLPISKENCGSKVLLNRVLEVKPKIHIFGHIHQSAGMIEKNGTKFVNASVLDDWYKPYRQPMVIDI